VRLPAESLLSRIFRWPLFVAGAFIVLALALFGYLYMQTAAYMTARIDRVMISEIEQFTTDTEKRRLRAMDDRLRDDPRRIKLGGLFASDGTRIAGNITKLPPGLPLEGGPGDAALTRSDNRGLETKTVRAIARQLPDGSVIVVGRNIDEIGEIAHIVRRVMVIGVLPIIGLAALAGVLISLRTQRRIDDISRTAQRIVAGDLRERLQTHRGDEDFNRLGRVINGMLGEIEQLINDIAGVSDDIAHELRTPLTRTRAILERGRNNARTLEELQDVVDRSVAGLDRALAIVTALLRIAEIEHRRRLEGFGEVEPASLVREVAELYQPIAEDRQVALGVKVDEVGPLRGDRDLLFEAIANLVDNAIKFTPPGGQVELALIRRGDSCAIQVADSGPGIAEAERDAVTRRFYRSDKSRRTRGVGLGLTLVAAIAKLHGFQLSISGGPGCVVELICRAHDA
jgi:signal transduction histidine kinase